MIETNSTIKYDLQFTSTMRSMADVLTQQETADVYNDMGLNKPLSLNPFTKKDVAYITGIAHRRNLRQANLPPLPDQIVDVDVMLSKFKAIFTGETNE